MKDFKKTSVCNSSSPEECMEILFGLIGDGCTEKERCDIEKAYRIANEAHEGQKRLSGEPYIMHPLSVAIILASLGMDEASIIAALLHDTVEDTKMTNAEVKREFGETIADLVEDLAAEQKARVTYDNILRLSDDPDVNDVIRFLRQREVVHFQRFGDVLRKTQEGLDQKNYYSFNPEYTKRK